jgi:dolichol-phosphate mannosyltransferase
MKFAVWKLGHKIVEVPIIFTERKHGSSKMTGGIFNEALWGVIIMKIKSYFITYRASHTEKARQKAGV